MHDRHQAPDHRSAGGGPMTQLIAALFVETGGVYYGQDAVMPFDIVRDARTYNGICPVVAHPPCQRWGRFAKGSPLKGGEIPGADDGCFAFAFDTVNRCGGVIEHPAHSLAWRAFGIPKPPKGGGWVRCRSHNAWTCEVEQGHYGHVARKATWLYAVTERPPELVWGPSPQSLPAKRLAERGYASARRCGAVANQSSKQRQRTPAAFRDALLSIARDAMGAGTGMPF